jgi:hypothetical protein
VYIQWQGYDIPYPAKIDMFLDLRTSEISNNRPSALEHDESNPDTTEVANTGFQHTFLEKKLYAVVWSTKRFDLSRETKTDNHLPLNLAYRVELEPPFRRVVPVNSFMKPHYGR